jgi:adenine-specific DNA-methyltransferase
LSGAKAQNHFEDFFAKELGTAESAKKELTDILGQHGFETVKPIDVIKRLVLHTTENSDLILDFFSGSATTAHAVMQLNAEDGGKRKFIMVQLPEVCAEDSEAAKAGYANICEIGKERIRRAGKSVILDAEIKLEVNEFSKELVFEDASSWEIVSKLDIGFRVLKLDSSNMKDVYYTPDEYASMNFTLDGFMDNIKPDRSDEDLLFQVMLDIGVPLSAKIRQEGTVFYVDDSYLIACFGTVDTGLLTAIAKKKPYYAVFRDSSFESDSALVNFEQVFKTYSPTTIRRVL